MFIVQNNTQTGRERTVFILSIIQFALIETTSYEPNFRLTKPDFKLYGIKVPMLWEARKWYLLWTVDDDEMFFHE